MRLLGTRIDDSLWARLDKVVAASKGPPHFATKQAVVERAILREVRKMERRIAKRERQR